MAACTERAESREGREACEGRTDALKSLFVVVVVVD